MDELDISAALCAGAEALEYLAEYVAQESQDVAEKRQHAGTLRALADKADYCDRCGKLCWGDAGTAEERLERDGTVICGECAEELEDGGSWAGGPA